MVQIFVYTKVHVKWGLAKWVIITLQPRPFEHLAGVTLLLVITFFIVLIV